MKVIRQRTYSTRSKMIYAVKNAKDNANRTFNGMKASTAEYFLGKNSPKAAAIRFDANRSGKTKYQLMRETVEANNNISKAQKYLSTNTAGQIVSDGVGKVIENPITVTTTAIGAVSPVPGGSIIAGKFGNKMENALRNKSQVYRKVSSAALNSYNKTGKRLTAGTVDSVVGLAKMCG